MLNYWEMKERSEAREKERKRARARFWNETNKKIKQGKQKTL